MDSELIRPALLIGTIVACIACGSISIASVCLRWLRSHAFGPGGIALCTAGVILLGLSMWGSTQLAAEQEKQTPPPDNAAALERMVRDTNEQTIAAITQANK